MAVQRAFAALIAASAWFGLAVQFDATPSANGWAATALHAALIAAGFGLVGADRRSAPKHGAG